MSDVYAWRDPTLLFPDPQPFAGGRSRPEWCPLEVWSAVGRAYQRVGQQKQPIRDVLLRRFHASCIRELDPSEYPDLIAELDKL